jgi:hypothetical protein
VWVEHHIRVELDKERRADTLRAFVEGTVKRPDVVYLDHLGGPNRLLLKAGEGPLDTAFTQRKEHNADVAHALLQAIARNKRA